ncbi:hypothetical protein [Vibrio alfacsensis]|uniref:hypothetical protein n=1 Tax=Vibrio alfacsensis TaxID=1074311 RepID=UPI004068F548
MQNESKSLDALKTRSSFHDLSDIRNRIDLLFSVVRSKQAKEDKQIAYSEIERSKNERAKILGSLSVIEEEIIKMNSKICINESLKGEFDDGFQKYQVSLPKDSSRAKVNLSDKVLKKIFEFIKKEVKSTNSKHDRSEHYTTVRIGSLKLSPRKFADNTLVGVIGRGDSMITFVAIFKNKKRNIFIFDGCELL